MSDRDRFTQLRTLWWCNDDRSFFPDPCEADWPCGGVGELHYLIPESKADGWVRYQDAPSIDAAMAEYRHQVEHFLEQMGFSIESWLSENTQPVEKILAAAFGKDTP
jgi:hypothetical protein